MRVTVAAATNARTEILNLAFEVPGFLPGKCRCVDELAPGSVKAVAACTQLVVILSMVDVLSRRIRR